MILQSDTTLGRQIHEMAQDVVEQTVEKIKLDKQFAIQIDESSDICNDTQLIVYFLYFDFGKGIITDDILGCEQLAQHTRGMDIFDTLDSFLRLQIGLQWEWCFSMSLNGAAGMTGYKCGLVALIHTVNPDINWQHCIIHKQSLAAKKYDTLSRSLNSRLFKNMCEEIVSIHTQLLQHTDVQRVLARLFGLREDVTGFLSEQKFCFLTYFENVEWLYKLCYLADIFTKLNNELNLLLQGLNNNIFNTQNKAWRAPKVPSFAWRPTQPRTSLTPKTGPELTCVNKASQH
ncbi:hypothetical protein PR048_011230 [Dryococelus australis]|uniref:DUF4371 domain-containing protein n=1 Tax=Dryococelus australis TaxID=614101 RepID=A0ABQ9HL03_9NEOP|nr:hypothetical protein PR048_011230 [Dryococelus australis]